MTILTPSHLNMQITHNCDELLIKTCIFHLNYVPLTNKERQ